MSPNIKLRGVRAPMPGGYVVGRSGRGQSGPPGLLSLNELRQMGVASRQDIAAFGSQAFSDLATTLEALSGPLCHILNSGGAAIQHANATDTTKPANCFVAQAYGSGVVARYFLPFQWINGLTLTPCATYWLSTTGGALATAPPAAGIGAVSQIVGTADSSGTRLFFNPQPIFGI